METQAATQQKQTGAGPHIVHVRYVPGGDKDQELEVEGYPPEDLQVDQEIIFEPTPSGTLELTFEYGSNFADEGIDKCKINGQKPKAVVKREMTLAEFNKLKARADQEDWSPQKRAIGVKMNAFPFMCELTPDPAYRPPHGAEKISNPNTPISYKGGFPPPPHRP